MGAHDRSQARVRELVADPAARLSADQVEQLALAWKDPMGDGQRLVPRSNAALSALMVAKSADRVAAWSAARESVQIPGDSAAQEAGEHAACALVVEDLLSREQFEQLYGPWAAVAGWPDASQSD